MLVTFTSLTFLAPPAFALGLDVGLPERGEHAVLVFEDAALGKNSDFALALALVRGDVGPSPESARINSD